MILVPLQGFSLLKRVVYNSPHGQIKQKLKAGGWAQCTSIKQECDKAVTTEG